MILSNISFGLVLQWAHAIPYLDRKAFEVEATEGQWVKILVPQVNVLLAELFSENLPNVHERINHNE